jgi:hypothetical protein
MCRIYIVGFYEDLTIQTRVTVQYYNEISILEEIIFDEKFVYTIKVERIENNSHLDLSLLTSPKRPTCQFGSTHFGRRKGTVTKIFDDSKIFLLKTTVFSHPLYSYRPACTHLTRPHESWILFPFFILFSKG